MKKLSLTAVLVILMATCVCAHEGSLGLFTAETALDCDYKPAAPIEQITLYLVYYKSDSGPNGITAFEFMLEISSNVWFTSATWQQGFITNGAVMSGISVASQGCFGSGMTYAPLGNIKVFLTTLDNFENQYARIVPDPGAEFPHVYISMCDEDRTMHEVLGGWFLFNEGACLTGTETTSWGAIKSIYRN